MAIPAKPKKSTAKASKKASNKPRRADEAPEKNSNELAGDALATYAKKRDFSRTPEPSGLPDALKSEPEIEAAPLRFVVQRHDATNLHFDLRLEIDGSLLSFAVPKGFPETADEKRLAVETENHPLRYVEFEGTIPTGNYGAGDMSIWDVGSYDSIDRTPQVALDKGHFHIRFHGSKLDTEYHLVRTKRTKQWLLFLADPKGALKKRTAALALAKARGAIARATVAQLGPESGYLFEIKYDGYRLIAAKAEGEVALITRNGHDWTDRFKAIAKALRALPQETFVIDGEACVVDDRGIPRFEHLQRWLAGERTHGKIAFVAFDVLDHEGTDVRKKSLEARRSLLEIIFRGADAPLSVASLVPPPIAAAMAAAEAAGLEGLIAKKKGSAYVPGISGNWIKIKFSRRQEFVVVGFTPLERTTEIGALLLAVYEGGRFVYAGKVGTGFDDDERKKLKRILLGLKTTRPFAEGMPKMTEATFTAPSLVVEVRYAEWMTSGVIRHASYLGLREDRRAEDCVRERGLEKEETKNPSKRASVNDETNDDVDEETSTEESVEPVQEEEKVVEKVRPGTDPFTRPSGDVPLRFSNLDKLLYPKDGFKKRDVITYYALVAPAMLPHLARRPVHLQRWPDGIHDKEWYQHRVPPNPPTFVRRLPFQDGERVIVENEETLLWLANLAALSLHTWSSRVPARVRNEVELDESLGTPDYAVIDLDPQGDALSDWENMISVANAIRALLETLEMVSVVKTTGKRGLHIVIPLAPPVTHAESVAFAREIARAISKVLPDIATNELAKIKRKGRVLVDLAPNGRGKTMIAPYSLRAVDGGRASCPLLWSEVTNELDHRAFNLLTMRDRIERMGDLYAPALGPGGRVPKRG